MNTLRMNVLFLSARRYACAAAIAFAMFLAFSAPCSGQTSNNGQITNNGQLTRRAPSIQRDIDPSQMESMGTPMFYEKRLKMLNAAQHQSMVADTDRLLKLVADLNSQINKSNSNELTPEQLRMVAEIEKLAHSVKDKMRMSVRSAAEISGPSMASPFGAR
jgi:hypothetical protein